MWNFISSCDNTNFPWWWYCFSYLMMLYLHSSPDNDAHLVLLYRMMPISLYWRLHDARFALTCFECPYCNLSFSQFACLINLFYCPCILKYCRFYSVLTKSAPQARTTGSCLNSDPIRERLSCQCGHARLGYCPTNLPPRYQWWAIYLTLHICPEPNGHGYLLD